MTTIKQPFPCNLQPGTQEAHRTTHTDTTTRCKTHRRNNSRMKRLQPHPPHTHTRYLSSPAAATLHGKTQGFVPRLPPQNIAHATFMRHYNRFRSIPWQTCTYLRTWQHQMTTIKQPFQCNLQPEIQKPHRTTHTDTTIRCKTHRRNNSRMKRRQPHPPHTRGTFHRRLQPLYTEKHKVSCSGFLPKT